jgi:YVTN family beta-propeller protein
MPSLARQLRIGLLGLTLCFVAAAAFASSALAATAYVSNQGSKTVSVINTATNTPASTIEGFATAPDFITITPNAKLAYVTRFFSASASVFDTASNKLSSATLPVGAKAEVDRDLPRRRDRLCRQ